MFCFWYEYYFECEELNSVDLEKYVDWEVEFSVVCN